MVGNDRTGLAGFSPAELGKVLYKRSWTIAAFFVVVTVFITIAVFLQRNVYRAITVIQIESEAPDVVEFKDVVALGAQNYWAVKEYYETQFRIIVSRPVMEEVIARLNLGDVAPFAGSNNPAAQLADMITVEPIKNSQLVNLSVDFGDMETAVQIANTVARVYQEQNLNRRIRGADQALEWLGVEQTDRTRRVQAAEQALQDFLDQHDIVSFEEKQNIVGRRLQDLSDALTQATRLRIASQAAYNQAVAFRGQGKAHAIPEVVDNKLIQDAKQRLYLLAQEKEKLSSKYMPDHPAIRQVQKSIDEYLARIADEVNNIIESMGEAYQTDVAREQGMTEELAVAKKDGQELASLGIEYRIKKREAEAEGTFFDEIQKRQKQTEITKALPAISNNVTVVEDARAPKNPVPIRPRRTLAVLLGAFLGLIGGIGVALVLEYLDTTIKSAEDLERTVNAPFLGIIPSFATDENATPDELFTYRYPKSSITESCRSIRTNIMFSSVGKNLKRLLVTSAGPQEGKTTAVINLGIIFAQGDKKVLIVDSDLRRPRLHRAFKCSRKLGLTNLIMNEATLDDVIVATEAPNVFLIPCGPIPPNPSELLGGERMREISDQLAARFDLVLFDSPPVVAVTDAVVMSKMVDGVVLIAKAGKTTSEIIAKASRLLQGVGGHILGAVLNDFNVRSAGYRYYYYYYHYRSREGDDEGGAEKTVRKRVRRRRSESDSGDQA